MDITEIVARATVTHEVELWSVVRDIIIEILAPDSLSILVLAVGETETGIGGGTEMIAEIFDKKGAVIETRPRF